MSLARAPIARFGFVAVLTLTALALRMYKLGDENFWIDEVHQIRAASQPLVDIVRNYRPGTPYGTTDQAPLSLIVTHAFLSERAPEFSARFPSAVCGALGVPVLFILARQLLGFQPALLAALLLAISPLDVWYSQEARWYELWGLITMVSYLALVRAENQPLWRPAWWLFALASVVNVYTFVYSVFVMLSQGVSLLWRAGLCGGSRRAVRIFVGFAFAVFLVATPVVYMVGQHADEAHSGTPRSPSVLEFPYTMCAFSVGFTLGPTVENLHFAARPIQILVQHPVVVLVALVFGPLTLGGLWSVGKEKELRTWLLPWLLLPPLSVFVTAVVFPAMTYQVRYAFASLPAFLLVLAVGIASLGNRVRLVAVGGVVLLSVVSLGNLYWSERYDKEDVRGAVAHLRETDAGATQIVAVGQIGYAMYFYADHPDITVIRGCDRDSLGKGPLDRSRRVWLVCGRDWNRLCAPCLSRLSEDYVQGDRTTFVGVDLWRLDPRRSCD